MSRDGRTRVDGDRSTDDLMVEDVRRVPPTDDAGGALGRARRALRGFRLVAAGQVLSDAACFLGVLFVFGHRPIGPGADLVGIGVLILGPMAWVGVFHAFGLYGSMHLSAPEEFRRIISAKMA